MEYVEYNKQDIQSFKLDKTIVTDGQIAGSCELGIAEIQMINDSNEYSVFKNKWIKTDVGSFYVYEVKPVQEKINIMLSCYDIRYLLEVVYDKTKYESLFPCSIATWVNKIATDLGITINNVSDAPNANYVLNEHPYVEENTSYRIVLKQIAQACCSAIDTDLNDNLYFRWFSNKEHIIEDWFNLTSEKEYSVPINAVVLGRGNVEDLVVYPNPVPNNAKEFRIDNNYILDPQNTESDTDRRNEVIAPIYNRVNGLSYLIFNITTEDLIDSLNYNLGEKVKYTDMWGNEISTYGMTITYEWLSGDLSNSSNYKVTLSSSELNETSSEYNYVSNVLNDFNKVAFNVDKQNKVIQGIIQTQEENSSKISSLEIKDNEITSKVTSVENGLKTTNQNVSSLQASLDNVSADFEDFKDNEFINSIGNLQDQIDGAIQFWNGEEIPTINNYPANEWTTEEERNNHRADIYTVIEDVDGELKQGKAYRFDKVDNTWQWIELTDNELSAVQAIAQEALDKSNKNIGDIQELVKKTSELSVKDEEITASVEEINNKYEQDITLSKQASGSPIIVTDAGPYPLESIEIEGKSYQETRSGKNLLEPIMATTTQNGITCTNNGDGSFTLNGTATADVNFKLDQSVRGGTDNLKTYNGTYTLSCNELVSDVDMWVMQLDTWKTFLTINSSTKKASANINADNVFIYVRVVSGKTLNNLVIKPILVEGNVVGDFEQYGVSPSLDFPSEIKNVEGVTNLFDLGTSLDDYFATDNNGTRIDKDGNISNYVTANFDKNGVTISNYNNSGYRWMSKIITLEKNTDYIISGNIGNPIKICGFSSLENNADGTQLCYIDNANEKPLKTFNSGDYAYYVIAMYPPTNAYFNNVQIEKGKVVHPYVPYGRWLELKDNNINYLKDISSYIWQLNGSATTEKIDDYIKVMMPETPSRYSGIYLQNWRDTKKKYNNDTAQLLGKEVTYSFYAKADKDRTIFFQISDGKAYYINLTTKWERYSLKISSFAQSQVPVFYCGDTLDTSSYYIKDIMLQEGDLTDYEPNNETTALIDMNKDNLVKYPYYNKTKTENGITFTDNGDGSITINGTATADALFWITKEIWKYDKDNMPYFLKGTYTIGATGNSDIYLHYTIYGESGTTLADNSANSINKIVDLNENATATLRLRVPSGKTINKVTIYPKIYKGLDTNDNYSLAEDDTFEEGLYIQNRTKVILNGSENWYISGSCIKCLWSGFNPQLSKLSQDYDFATIKQKALCTHSSQVPPQSLWNGTNTYGFGIDTMVNDDALYFGTNGMSVDEWKAYLKEQYDAGTPVIVEYILATPIEHTLNYEVLELHEGYNNITTNDDLEPNMSITYLTDSKLNAKYATKGELKVTANNITSEINSTLKNGYTTIEQTNKIEQKITDTENEILLEVGKKVTTADYNKDKENLQNNIDSKVGEEDFTKAQIIAKINDKTSQIQINADSIDLNGVVTANENFKINEDGSMTAKAGVFGAWNIDDNGNMYADREVNGKIYRTYIQQANEEDGGETWAFSTQVSEDGGESFKMTSYISNDGKIITENLIYSEQDIIGAGLVGGNHLTAYNYEFDPSYIIPLYGQNIQSESFSIPSEESTAVLGLVLEPGRYLVVSQFKFSTNANGYRAVNIATSAGATDINVTQQAPSSIQTRIRHVAWLAPNSETTYYWNLRQNSGSTLTGDVWVQLYRVQ